jgi:RNA polymerase sigma-70 factor (ECF subfamily)
MAADTLEESAFDENAFGATASASSPRLSAADVGSAYEAHFQFVWRCLRSLGVRDDALDDALQDVFVVVHDKLHLFDGKANLRTWIYGIALRVARRYRERTAKDARKFVSSTESGDDDPGEELDALSGRTGDLERELDTSERLALARRALEMLDDEKREAFVLACVEQMSAPEIAEITGLPLNTVYSRIRAARLAFTARVARMQALARRSPR